MDVHSLKNHIIENEDLIELILEKAGFHHIDSDFAHGNEVRFARNHDRNPTSNVIYKDTLGGFSYSENMKGDIFTFVQKKMNVNFPKTLELVSSWINYVEVEPVKFELPFGGFYKNIMKLRNDDYLDLEKYSDDILNKYGLFPSKMFYEDGIDVDTQIKFNIGYDFMTNRITIPWRDFSGSSIVGIIGRLNRKELLEGENKYYPVIPFPKSKTLFGYSENYNSIQEKGLVLLGESEKFTMQLASMGLNVGLSLGGSNLSDIQSNNIKSLFPSKIIVMLDEGLSDEVSYSIAEKLKMNTYFKNDVYVCSDKNGLYLPKDSKMSPADLHKSDLNSLLKNCLYKVS